MCRTSQHLLCFSILLLSFFVSTAFKIIRSPPIIVKEPSTNELFFVVATSINEEEKPFVIDCEAEGYPAPKYKWKKNGNDFDWRAYDGRISQKPGHGSLNFTKPIEKDSGLYQCFAKNDRGTATSKSVKVVNAELYSFKKKVNKTIEAQEGDPFKLNCHPPNGRPKPNVTWIKQNTDGGITSINNCSRMTLDPEGNLWFSNVTRYDSSDNFAYRCMASSDIRSEFQMGNRIHLNVIQSTGNVLQNKVPPTKQYVTRGDEEAFLGKKVELFCIYGGTPLPKYFWYKDNSYIEFNDRVTLRNFNKSLIIRTVEYEDEGNYSCVVTNGVGSRQYCNIQLKVMAVPYFIVTPTIVEEVEGNTAIITCEATGNPVPEINWIHNGLPIKYESLPKRSVDATSITIRGLTKSDTGNYGCNATNIYGYVYKDIYINVFQASAPEITESPRNVDTVERRSVTIGCRNFGVPKPRVNWTRNNIQLDGGRYSILDSGDLQIDEVGFGDAGNYTCIISNIYGTANASGQLNVKEITQIVTIPEDKEAAVGSTVTFHCTATADRSLHLSIDWFAENKLIHFDSKLRFDKSENFSMTINKIIASDSGFYKCLAKTELDNVSATAQLIVQDKPNPPELLEIVCNNTNARIKWQSNGDNEATILHYTIEYNTSFAPDSWYVASDNIPANNRTYEYRTVRLTPWANFTFRVIATNKIGRSNPSLHSNAVCTTQPDVACKNPDNVEVAGTEPSNLVITWTPMPKIEHHAPGLRYRVYWKPDVTGQIWNYHDTEDYTAKELVVNDLPPYRRFSVRVVAFNDMGHHHYLPQKEVVGYSGEGVPTDAPQNLTVLHFTGSKSVALSWKPISPESIKGNFKGYKIQFWTKSDGENNVIEVQVGSNTTTVEIQTLLPNTKYYMRIIAYNSRFNGPPSQLISFDTSEVPGPVNGVKVKPWGSSAILLTWKKPERAYGVLTGYEISYESMTQNGIGEKTHRLPIIDPNQITAKLAPLKPDTDYRIHIRATTKYADGESVFIDQHTKPPLSEGTELDKPEYSFERLATNNIFDTVRLKWIPNLDGNPGSYFFVKYRMKGGSLRYNETKPELDENVIDVKDLKRGLYEFVVVAVDGNSTRESDIAEIDISSVPEKSGRQNEGNVNVVTSVCFIAIILALVCLISILVMVRPVFRVRSAYLIGPDDKSLSLFWRR